VADEGTAMNEPMWRARRAFWNRYQRWLFRAAKPLVVPVPGDLPPVRAVPFSSAYPKTPIGGLVVAHQAPKDEYRFSVLAVKRLQLALYRTISPMQHGMPQVDADPERALTAAYPPRHERLYRRPVRPAEYGDPEQPGGVDLGGLAVASPYACYLTRDDTGALVWDLTGLAGFEVHDGLVPPAARVVFEVDPERRRVTPVRIDSELGNVTPADDGWNEAVRLAMCAVSTHVSLVRHFDWLHLVVGGPLAIVTHNELPADHPVARLLRPHVYATHFGNRIVTIDQMERGGDFENIFSFTHAGICKLFEATAGELDLRWFNPERDAELRNIANLPIDMPALDNRVQIMGVIRDHVARYLALYYESDDALLADRRLARWVDQLDRGIPHGVRELSGDPMTTAGVAELLATLVYMGVVEHEIIDSGMWDYQLWNDVQPVRVHRDGQRVSLDVYQRLVNWNFSLNVDRTLLTTDFSGLALDPRGADEFRRFRTELLELQRTMDAEPRAPWRMEPKFLKANINY
jgi:arachidonate 15-lipoxygenase